MKKWLLRMRAMLLAVLMGAPILFSSMPAAAAPISGAPLTRADIEEAVVETAWAYYFKGGQIQYDSEILTPMFSKYYGGSYRVTENAAPEYGTDDTTILSVCSDFCHKAWLHATGHAIMGEPLNTVTRCLWENSEKEGLLVARWWRRDYTLTEADIAAGITKDSAYNLSTEDMRAFLTNFEENMRPGDIMVADGHALLYVGEGFVIDCSGNKYSMTTGIDMMEPKGSLDYLHRFYDAFVSGADAQLKGNYVVSDTSSLDHLTIVRPSLALCVDDGDGDLGNDIMKEADYQLPAAAQSRLDYPGLEINRTVDVSPFGTVAKGETLTYTVAISNRSNHADYKTYHTQKSGAPYSGEMYQNLAVREVVPVGTSLVDASSGALVSGSDINWTLHMPAGEEVKLTYTVRVNGDIGDVVVSEGGSVAHIPSNSISNTIGGAKLNDDARSGLGGFYEAGVEKWLDNYNICAATSDLDYAERVYGKAAGLALELPSIQDLFEGAFKQVHLTRATGAGYMSAGTEAWMYSLKTPAEVNPADRAAYAMIVDGYFGGKSVYVERPATCINEFSFDYLEPGDILVYANLTPYQYSNASRKVRSTQTIVYLGNNRIAMVDSQGNMIIEEGVWANIAVWKAFLFDFFVALRPSEAIANVNLQVYDPANEPDYTDWINEQSGKTGPTEIGTTELNAQNKAILSVLTSAGNDYGVRFARNAYQAMDIGITVFERNPNDILLALTGTNGFTTDPAKGRQYRIAKSAADATDETIYNMLVPGYYGGDWIDASEVTAPLPVESYTLDMLKAGDIVLMSNRTNNAGPYLTGVYRGDGSMLMSYRSIGGTIKSFVRDVTDETLVQMLKENPEEGNAWTAYYILRPSLAYYDINDLSYTPLPPSAVGTSKLNAQHRDALAQLTGEGFAGGIYGVGFGASVYAAIGVDISDVLTKDDTPNGILGKIAAYSSSGGQRSYKIFGEAPAGFEKLYAMLVPGYYGGTWIDASNATPQVPAASYNLDMLEVGDIVIMGNANGPTGGAGPYLGGVYQGGGKMLMSYRVASNNIRYYVESLTDASFAQMLQQNPDGGADWMTYYILRPSRAYYDINDPAWVPEPVEEPGESVPLSEENKARIAALAPNTWSPGQRNLSFAGHVYERIGLDIRSNGIGTFTFASALDAICMRMGDANDRDFLLLREKDVPTANKGLYNMLLPGYYGGPGIYNEGVLGLVTTFALSDLEIGDIVAAGNWSTSHYASGIYQGEGQFLFSELKSGKETWYTDTLDDSGYAAFLGDEDWKAFYVLRPYLGFVNINERTTVPTTNIALACTLNATIGDAPVKLQASVMPEGGEAIAWSSDNEAVASVSSDGTVTFASVGSASIIVTVGSARAVCVVMVVHPPAVKDALQEAVDGAVGYQQGDYTADSFRMFADALADAQAALADMKATQAEVDAALDALHAAIDSLEPRKPAPAVIPIEHVENGNKQAAIYFPILSLNGKGYTLYLSETGEDDTFAAYADVNYNAHGAHVKKLANVKTYYAYVVYEEDGTVTMQSGIVELCPGK